MTLFNRRRIYKEIEAIKTLINDNYCLGRSHDDHVDTNMCEDDEDDVASSMSESKTEDDEDSQVVEFNLQKLKNFSEDLKCKIDQVESPNYHEDKVHIDYSENFIDESSL